MSASLIPDAALNSHIGILGKTGSGKTYTAKGLVERLLHARRQVVIIDPTGAWYGLRTGFEIPIFGGRNGDIEISDKAGDAVAAVIVNQRASAIIDLSLMSGGAQRRFMTAFAHKLRQKPPGALWLVIDEADEFLPQVLSPDMTNLFGDLKWMVRRGRLNGFRVMMVTQRPAEIAKAVLTQIETLVAHRLTAPQDRKAIEEWVKGHHAPEEAKEVLGTLASLDRGTAWVWAPDLNILAKAEMPPIQTFDSSRTPEADEEAVEPPALASLDLSAIKDALSEVADAPATVVSKGVVPSWPDQRKEVEALTAANAALEGALKRAAQALKIADDAVQEAHKAVTEVPIALPKPKGSSRAFAIDYRGKEAGVSRKPNPPRQAPIGNESVPAADVPSGCAKPLAVLSGVYPGGITEAQWATAAGYKRTGGTWKEYRSRLKRAEMIELRGDLYYATELGAQSAGDVELPPAPGPALARWWAARISGTPRLVELLIDAWPHALTRDELADRLGMVASGGSFKEYLSRLKRNGITVEHRGGIVLAQEVMGA